MMHRNADETDPKKKEALLREAVDIAKAALEKHPNHADLHKWMAIALGKCSCPCSRSFAWL
jgi:hypothetical protein